jgi:hypothetical protein
VSRNPRWGSSLKAPSRAGGYNVRMDIAGIVAEIDLEIARLEKAKALIAGQTAPSKRGRPPATQPKTAAKRTMSAEGRARIAAAQKARWAKAKKKG